MLLLKRRSRPSSLRKRKESRPSSPQRRRRSKPNSLRKRRENRPKSQLRKSWLRRRRRRRKLWQNKRPSKRQSSRQELALRLKPHLTGMTLRAVLTTLSSLIRTLPESTKLSAISLVLSPSIALLLKKYSRRISNRERSATLESFFKNPKSSTMMPNLRLLLSIGAMIAQL